LELVILAPKLVHETLQGRVMRIAKVSTLQVAPSPPAKAAPGTCLVELCAASRKVGAALCDVEVQTRG
jgi:hypothetical protein